MSSHAEDHSYHPKDAISAALKATALTGSVGLFASAVQNTLVRRNVGPLGIFTRSGATISVLAAMGGTYEFVKTASANLRETEDSFNTALGGFFSGSILGLRFRTFPAVLKYGAGLSIAMYAFDYTGGSLFGPKKDTEEDEFDRRQKLRKSFQTPAEQTFAEIGEGRGIYGPNYEERRAQRIKEAYGIEVPTQPLPAS
ncbi:Mitochondrial inner membrane translocase subunit Tim17/Tim22/Tim23/peroxisomal protein PMP24 [Penicillium chermesinum]|uniref:Mitochondrial inner membrane translocase subunit Tim17/Tim22/Tim23/peroxisomal protein PMP24 n=1 Tax=Penicillium chermesinum TaxID=63820 RepID=A0A9W9TMZ1_9EURO|nr:Mitochondrial inner membrane translocase subunit Tim17/Tim22/Tim23/peroxisomal protein PMP24 [Penicillium chermesinum]KAJ5232088.1 Mitochondrial inner membrane translocase subunit Tim17/Tim22/Tim23/peroxisomal protein PMP24 [Penicillium chermesinum]KAJ6171754.1 Mitochondrial inner membrane translocase subunit Tim17/Tim22/Tim23/peroxisomal protein PMP24 [Penicillium chermesinum]